MPALRAFRPDSAAAPAYAMYRHIAHRPQNAYKTALYPVDHSLLVARPESDETMANDVPRLVNPVGDSADTSNAANAGYAIGSR